MTDEECAHAVERFWRRGAGGSGLGLGIVKAIAERYGGSLNLLRGVTDGLETQLVFPGHRCTSSGKEINEPSILHFDSHASSWDRSFAIKRHLFGETPHHGLVENAEVWPPDQRVFKPAGDEARNRTGSMARASPLTSLTSKSSTAKGTQTCLSARMRARKFWRGD